MKRGQLIAVAISAFFCIAFTYIVWNMVKQPTRVVKEEIQTNTTQVLVARTELGLGQMTTADSFRWQDWPQSAVNASYVQRSTRPNAIKDLTGAIARAPLLAGEPVTVMKLVKAGEGGVLASILPAGMRAISTKIKEETGVGKLILPNDHVDVILIQRKRGRTGADEYIADTLFRNVRVLAIGQLIEAKDGKKGAEGNTATLELTPRQSELLALANSMGEISLALRSVADLDKNQEAVSGNGLQSSQNRGNSVRVLRYGAKSRAYGVN
jgi:pilus assembly protein CpaB